MARPPSRGMGTLCIRRASLGTSMAPTFLANSLTMGVMAKEMARATPKAKKDVIKTLLSIISIQSSHQKGFLMNPTFL